MYFQSGLLCRLLPSSEIAYIPLTLCSILTSQDRILNIDESRKGKELGFKFLNVIIIIIVL